MARGLQQQVQLQRVAAAGSTAATAPDVSADARRGRAATAATAQPETQEAADLVEALRHQEQADR